MNSWTQHIINHGTRHGEKNRPTEPRTPSVLSTTGRHAKRCWLRHDLRIDIKAQRNPYQAVRTGKDVNRADHIQVTREGNESSLDTGFCQGATLEANTDRHV